MAERDGAACTFTFAGSSRARASTATACTENASLNSKRSTSVRSQPTFCRDLAHGFDRRHQHEFRRQSARRLPDDARHRRQAEASRASAAMTTSADGAVVDARRIAGGDAAVLLERRLRAASVSTVVSARIASSRSNDERRAFLLRDAIGRISSLNQPALGRARGLAVAVGRVCPARRASTL